MEPKPVEEGNVIGIFSAVSGARDCFPYGFRKRLWSELMATDMSYRSES